MQSVLNNNTTQSTTNGNSAVAANGTGTSPSDLFTTLLVAQIRNQNPLDPADPSEFVNQLTQLSQVEALQTLASQGTSNATVMQSMQVLALGAQVGSQVTVRSTSVNLDQDAVKGHFDLESGSAKVAVVLTDAAGKETRIDLGTRSPGEVAFTIDPDKLNLPAGRYAMRVVTDSEASPGIDIVGELRSVKLSSTGDVVLNVANLGEISSSLISGFYGRGTGQGS